LYLEQNISPTSSDKKIKKAEQKLFKKYQAISKQYLRLNLFENHLVIKVDKVRYMDFEKFVTIYYDHLSDLFAIVDSANYLIEFGIATERRK
jgi:tRNA uridine 5-carbamoylmethylation protein Kti12